MEIRWPGKCTFRSVSIICRSFFIGSGRGRLTCALASKIITLQLNRNIISPRLANFLFIVSHQRLTALFRLNCVYHVLLSTTEILYLWADRNLKETGAPQKNPFNEGGNYEVMILHFFCWHTCRHFYQSSLIS